MKAFEYILSFYLILLSAVPCCAFDGCPDDKNATQQTAGHQSGDQDDCGNCSPFFNCEGCCSAVLTIGTVTESSLIFYTKPSYTEFTPAFIPEVFYDFWQPPRNAKFKM